jgi:uncharacterized membrane protein
MDQLKSFVATGYRRMSVALVAILVTGVVEIRGGDLSQWGAIALIGITLGYFSSKFVEMVTALVPVMLEWIKGKGK